MTESKIILWLDEVVLLRRKKAKKRKASANAAASAPKRKKKETAATAAAASQAGTDAVREAAGEPIEEDNGSASDPDAETSPRIKWETVEGWIAAVMFLYHEQVCKFYIFIYLYTNKYLGKPEDQPPPQSAWRCVELQD